MSVEMERARNDLARVFFETAPETAVMNAVTGVGIGAPILPGQHVDGAASQVIVVFVEAVGGERLESIWKLVEAHSSGQACVLLPTSRPVGQAAPGNSISPYAPQFYHVPAEMAGTFGAVLNADGERYILSANHVMAFNGRVPLGSPIVDPGTLDDPDGASVIGELSHFVEMLPASWPATSSPKNRVDCALAKLTDDTGLGPLQGAAVVEIPPGCATRVHKRGRSTRRTTGTLCIWKWDGFIDLSFGTFFMTNLMGVIGDGPEPFAAPGDSGAVVVTDAGAGVGMVMARAYSSGTYVPPGGSPQAGAFVGDFVLVCPLTSVRDELGARLGIKGEGIEIEVA